MVAVQKYSSELLNSDGSKLEINFSNNIFIKENDDYSKLIYFKEENITRKYVNNEIVEEISGNILEGQSDLISILITPEDIDLPTGNNLLFSFTNDVNVTSGDGNDIFILANTNNITLTSSGGNNTIKGLNLANATINLGPGNNVLSVQKLANSNVSFADGNNKIEYNAGSINQNNLDVSSDGGTSVVGVILDGSSLIFSEGTQKVSISYLLNSSEISINNPLGSSLIDIKYMDQSNVYIYEENPTINVGDISNSTIKVVGDFARININSMLAGAKLNIDSHIAFANITSMENLSMIFANGLQNSINLGDKADSAYVYTKSNYSVISYKK